MKNANRWRLPFYSHLGTPRFLLLLLTLPLFSAGLSAQEQEPAIVFSATGTSLCHLDASTLACLEQAALDEAVWQQLFPVLIEGARRPLMGRYQVTSEGVLFQPRFPFAPGKHYEAQFNLRKLSDAMSIACGASLPQVGPVRHTIPIQTELPATQVTAIYPSTEVLPVNQLKIYITFSAPMREGQALRLVKLYDAESGVLVEEPFVNLRGELWDLEHKRLTLLFDPGRIKRGLAPNLLKGLPLVEGKRYRLEVEQSYLDDSARPLAQAFVKEFRVGPADRRSPDPEFWQVKVPPALGRDPLILDFGEPLDFALLSRVLEVVDDRNHVISGVVAMTNAERQWRFTPAQPWQQGHYRLRIDTWLEDLAGNNLNRLFDVDLEVAGDVRGQDPMLSLPFNVH